VVVLLLSVVLAVVTKLVVFWLMVGVLVVVAPYLTWRANARDLNSGYENVKGSPGRVWVAPDLAVVAVLISLVLAVMTKLVVLWLVVGVLVVVAVYLAWRAPMKDLMNRRVTGSRGVIEVPPSDFPARPTRRSRPSRHPRAGPPTS
jgi:hypothetical protein